MSKKKISILAIVIILFLCFCFFILISAIGVSLPSIRYLSAILSNSEKINQEVSSSDQANCAKEGETIGLPGSPNNCCSNLRPLYNMDLRILYDLIEVCIAGFGTGQLCSNCGDGLCNEYTGENKCNCPSDCYKKNAKKCFGLDHPFGEDENISCCPGLKPIKRSFYQGKWEMLCSACGDGRCYGWEAKDNCPEDCK